MLVPLQNVRAWRPVIEAADQLASPRVVERALHATGLSRRMIEGPPVFIPYALQAAFGESVSRQIGEPHVGPLLVGQYGYLGLGTYAQYVLGAARLDVALARGVRALPYLQSGVCVNLSEAGTNVVLQFDSGIQSVVGAGHVDEGSTLLLVDLVRHFVGPDWHPEWVELTKASRNGDATLESVFGAPIRYGSRISGIAIPKGMLLTRNPRSGEARNEILFGDVRSMVRQHPPRSTADLVLDTLRLMSVLGDFSEEVVAARLGIGKRTLQRQLAAEGHRFRDIVVFFQMKRAEALLLETDFSVQEIARCLGYREVNSFRRAFRTWTGMTPTEYCARSAGNGYVVPMTDEATIRGRFYKGHHLRCHVQRHIHLGETARPLVP